MGMYLLQVFLFQALFIAFYLLVLRRETFFMANRVYLMSTAVLAFLLPFFEFDVLQQNLPLQMPVQQLPEIVLGVTNEGHIPYYHPGTYNETPFWLALMYVIGFTIAFRFFAKKILEVDRLFRFRKKGDRHVITVPNRLLAFTFLRTIFLGDHLHGHDREQVLAHENVHRRQGHGFDLIFFEILRIVMWFNPLIYAYQFFIAETHEFLADKRIVKQTGFKSYANQLLNLAFETRNVSFVNSFFNQSLIKKRIVMLQKQSKNTARLKYLLILPLIAAMIAVASCSEESTFMEEEVEVSEHLSSHDMIMASIDELIVRLESKEGRTPKEEELLVQYKEFIKAVALSKQNGDALPPPPPPPAPQVVEVVEMRDSNQYQSNDVPFAVIDEVPKFPECEGMENSAAKQCFSDRLQAIVKENFNTKMGQRLGLTGVNRVYVQFKISTSGEIIEVQSRGPHPELEEEAKRVMGLIPTVKPGKQGGQEVAVLYSLPISFHVQ